MVFTVIDIETTGLSKHYHKITEIAGAKVRNGKIKRTFQSLVNPETRIPSFITKLTGINNEMVKDAPTIDKVLPKFTRFLGKDVFVAHYATFDYGFIYENLKKHQDKQLLNNKLCTGKLANRIYPDLTRKRLQDLCEHLNIKNNQAHRAMGDVKATAQVFTDMLNQLNEKGINKTEDIIKFERMPLAQTIRIIR